MTSRLVLSRPLLLIILDGWGWAASTTANAIAQAAHPTWDTLLHTSGYALLAAAGPAVGLPENQMGNSEVGHLHISAGRIVPQGLSRINHAIDSEEFFRNPSLLMALQLAKETKKAVHLIGLLSPGGVHSHEKHFYAMIALAKQMQVPTLFIHAFLDGRDTPPRSALASLLALEEQCRMHQCGQIASLIGRYYAMDRDQRWERIEKAYHLLTAAQAIYHAPTAQAGLLAAYERQESDEFVQATSIRTAGQHPVTIQSDDSVIFMNFRADRARALTTTFTDPLFQGFTRQCRPKLAHFICLAEYHQQHGGTTVAFPPPSLPNILPACLSQANLHQLRIAETEKYAHITFFFNGGQEEPFPQETRLLIPSPKVATYDLQPAMSAPAITTQLIAAITQNQYDVIICNFANPDMVGHTGNLPATIQAIETIDICLGQLVATIKQYGGEMLITADHGNAECMFDPVHRQAHTAHTTNPVPFLYVGPRRIKLRRDTGQLIDVAPTILSLLGLTIPPEMTGEPLLEIIA